MARLNSRELQEDLLERLKECTTESEIIDNILGWVDSDTACNCLKDMCNDWDIDIEDILEEEKINMKFAEARDRYRRGEGHFFDNENMMFWSSKVFPDLYGGRYFITSEPNYDGKDRRFTVREFTDNYSDVRTVGEFRQYKTLAEATKAVKCLLQV